MPSNGQEKSKNKTDENAVLYSACNDCPGLKKSLQAEGKPENVGLWPKNARCIGEIFKKLIDKAGIQ